MQSVRSSLEKKVMAGIDMVSDHLDVYCNVSYETLKMVLDRNGLIENFFVNTVSKTSSLLLCPEIPILELQQQE